jgi:hypothetical protein
LKPSGRASAASVAAIAFSKSDHLQPKRIS